MLTRFEEGMESMKNKLRKRLSLSGLLDCVRQSFKKVEAKLFSPPHEAPRPRSV